MLTFNSSDIDSIATAISQLTESELKTIMNDSNIEVVDKGNNTYNNGMNYSLGLSKYPWFKKCLVQQLNKEKNGKPIVRLFKSTFNNSRLTNANRGVKGKFKALPKVFEDVNAILANKEKRLNKDGEIVDLQIKETEKKYNYDKLIEELNKISKLENSQDKGYALEDFLKLMFAEFDIISRPPYKIEGEQIDGAFEFEYETYLIEAKWQKNEVSTIDINYFKGKVDDKSKFTRGVMISESTYNQYAIDHNTNQGANFILINVVELYIAFQHKEPFSKLLKLKWKALTEEGKVFSKIML
ncbi:MAG: hypothetical protein WCQ75_00615 [Bacilli bacterium]